MTKRTFSAQALFDLRVASGLSQVELAKKTGVHSQTIASLEQGSRRDPRISTVCDLAYGLDVEPGELLVAVSAKRA